MAMGVISIDLQSMVIFSRLNAYISEIANKIQVPVAYCFYRKLLLDKDVFVTVFIDVCDDLLSFVL